MKPEELPRYVAQIKGDAGIYRVWVVDWVSQTLLIWRANDYEKVSFNKVKKLELEDNYI